MAVVYYHWDAEGNLLYVGCTDNLDQRTKDHRRSPWAAEIDEISADSCVPRQQALKDEAEAIYRERPRHNTVHQYHPPRPILTPREWFDHRMAGRVSEPAATFLKERMSR